VNFFIDPAFVYYGITCCHARFMVPFLWQPLKKRCSLHYIEPGLRKNQIKK